MQASDGKPRVTRDKSVPKMLRDKVRSPSRAKCSETKIQIRVTDRVMDSPVVQHKKAPTLRTVQKIVETPQGQFLDKVVDMLVGVQRQVPVVQKMQKIAEVAEVHQVQFLDNVVDVIVVMRRQVPTSANCPEDGQ